MKSIKLRISLAIPVAMVCTRADDAIASCKDVLDASGRVLLSEASAVASAAESWFCSSEFESHVLNNSGSIGITVPIKGVPVRFSRDASDDSLWSKRSEFCQSQRSKFSTAEARTVISQMPASKEAIAAWLECKRLPALLDSTAVEVSASSASSTASLVAARVRWAIPTGTGPKLLNVHVTPGLQCSLPPLGEVLTTSGVGFVCQRSGDVEQVIMAETAGQIFWTMLPERTCGKPYGRAWLKVKRDVDRVQKGPDVSGQWTTHDGHCSGGLFDCKGKEKARVHTFVIRAPQDWRFSSHELRCIGGPCNGWWEVKRSQVAPTLISYDVETWSRPHTFVLVGHTQKVTRVEEVIDGPAVTVALGNSFSVMTPADGKDPVLVVEPSGKSPLVSDPLTPVSPIVYEQFTGTGPVKAYTYSTKCD